LTRRDLTRSFRAFRSTHRFPVCVHGFYIFILQPFSFFALRHVCLAKRKRAERNRHALHAKAGTSIDRVTQETKQVTHYTAFGSVVRAPAWRPGTDQMALTEIRVTSIRSTCAPRASELSISDVYRCIELPNFISMMIRWLDVRGVGMLELLRLFRAREN